MASSSITGHSMIGGISERIEMICVGAVWMKRNNVRYLLCDGNALQARRLKCPGRD